MIYFIKWYCAFDLIFAISVVLKFYWESFMFHTWKQKGMSIDLIERWKKPKPYQSIEILVCWFLICFLWQVKSADIRPVANINSSCRKLLVRQLMWAFCLSCLMNLCYNLLQHIWFFLFSSVKAPPLNNKAFILQIKVSFLWL